MVFNYIIITIKIECIALFGKVNLYNRVKLQKKLGFSPHPFNQIEIKHFSLKYRPFELLSRGLQHLRDGLFGNWNVIVAQIDTFHHRRRISIQDNTAITDFIESQHDNL
uniref:Uncharacterized protein n=1 Tax=Ceratitis capitata TaxID=7213 RepID=W8BP51_CERCA